MEYSIQTRVIEIVSEAAKLQNIDFLLIGAYARNLFLMNNPAVPIPRWTYDVDVACQVRNWEEYHALVQVLIEKYGFRRDSSNKHRLLFEKEDMPLDIIPFGGVENSNGEIFWPPNFDTCLNVRGFKAALHSADEMSIGRTMVKIIKPPLFALLKLISYLDDNSRTKDLKDFCFVANNYFDITDADARVYANAGPDADILEKEDFDYIVAGAELIGRDSVSIDKQLSSETAALILAYNESDKLTIALSQACALSPANSKRIISGLLDEIIRNS
jgi:predicted nucleotidyltransferase